MTAIKLSPLSEPVSGSGFFRAPRRLNLVASGALTRVRVRRFAFTVCIHDLQSLGAITGSNLIRVCGRFEEGHLLEAIRLVTECGISIAMQRLPVMGLGGLGIGVAQGSIHSPGGGG